MGMEKYVVLLAVPLLVICYFSHVRSDLLEHRYNVDDAIPLYVNKVGPFENPSETYGYYSLPFCRPDRMEEKQQTFGEILIGDRFVTAPFNAKFLQRKDQEVACAKKLTSGEVSQFQAAIKQGYYFQMYCDDLPIWGFIGKFGRSSKNKSEHKYLLYQHFEFEIFFNKDQIIETHLLMNPNEVVELTEGREVDIKILYSVHWIETNAHFNERMKKYSVSRHSTTHYFSIINACGTFLILFGCLLIYYMRVIRKDFYDLIPEDAAVDREQTGWKCIRTDVFRYPEHRSLFAAALGSGAQLCILASFTLLLGLLGVYYPYNRGNLFIALIVLYTMTSGFAGYLAVLFYCQIEGKNWGKNLLLTGSLSFVPLFLIFCFLNTVAVSYQANAALPLGTILLLLFIWISLALPLLVLGGISGKKSHGEFKASCETSKCPREVPSLRWYRGTLPQMVLAGLLPFSTIYIQLYYIFASMWGHRVYTHYNTIFVIFVILLITTSLITVALTHFQLAAEDHRWWLRSFLCGGSVGLYVYGFCFYYYYWRSNFSGFLQLSFFFGYMAWICYCIFLMCGSVGFYASLLYVQHIYSSIKSD
ncbi:transmembrane 9 superfamily member 2-like [Rhodamnia argentea]|uniref:Transmembrane 9 superfamily member n=1 Tax=Rhodamnia argentea TaxID=178133 RepID=A0A8B8P2K5_9MYRT|nr:transmembrane 9 superfamily member 2-like [Rhodamnia argentea]XP_048135434.1 transmembrane 9 superfamily member 2-like [Rhodamnia argentea]XP_048135435.1 transmembrane 9 superfamily member 2-like [Rhodamnia argentea]